MTYIKKNHHFCDLKKTRYRPTDGRTDGRTDGQTDGWTDTPSYRDARTHLKTMNLYLKNIGPKILWFLPSDLKFLKFQGL